LLEEAKKFFERELSMQFTVFSAMDKNKYDPKNKAEKAIKGKGAIYLE